MHSRSFLPNGRLDDNFHSQLITLIMKKETWETILRLIIAALAGIAGALGITACSHFENLFL